VVVPRTPIERAAFDIALNSIQVFYAHQRLFAVLISTLPEGCTAPPYHERGWVRRLSSNARPLPLHTGLHPARCVRTGRVVLLS
jgi:hypothetical protein